MRCPNEIANNLILFTMKKCEKCGYNFDGERCPMCGYSISPVNLKPLQEPPMYGPPIPPMYAPRIPVMYGPPKPKRRKSFWKYIIFIVCAILGGILYLFSKKFSTLYGPPSVDSLQQIIGKREMQPDLYGPPPINEIEQSRDRINNSETSEP